MRARLRALRDAILRRDSLESGMDDELRFHLEARADDLVRRGLSRSEAARQARAEFGGVAIVKEDCRRSLGLRLAGDLTQDLAYALRCFRKNRAFTAVAVLTLAVGIAANSAIFGVVNGVLLRPLPFRDAGKLVNLWRARPAAGTTELSVSIPTFEDWKRQSRGFEDLGFYTVSNVPRHLIDWRQPPEDPPMVWHSTVSANFFELLGAAPAAGRTFTAQDAAGRERVAVIAHAVWTNVFGATPAIAGRMVTLGGLPYQIIGVMPAEFDFPARRTGVWTPIEIDPSWAENRTRRDLALVNAFGRLRPETAVAAAQAEMAAVASSVGPADERVFVVPVQAQMLGKSLPFTLFVLLGAVACVLLIACSNIANLLLARGAARSREMAVRAALGAGRFRLLRQMLTESTLLGLAGGAVAIPMAVWGFNALKLLGAQSVPRLEQAQLDVRVLVFTFAVSLLAGISCGLIPALRVSRLRIAGRSGALPQILVAAQLALAVVLLAGGALMIRSFLAVLAVDPGFTPQGVLTVELRRANRAPGIVDEITARLRRLPGVQAVGTVNDVLLLDNVKWGEAESGRCTLEVEGQPSFANETCGPSYTPPNSGEALQALGLRLKRGRWFTNADGPGAPPTALINEAMMRRFWRGQDPLGTRFRGCGRCPWVTVAGVVGDIHHVGLERDAVLQWFPAPLQSKPGATVVIRASGDLAQLAPMVRKTIREVDRGAAIWQVDSLERQLEAQVAGRRLQAWLLGILSAIALALAGIGIYGVMHYSVAQRTREIGVRMALGARPREVLGMVLRQGLTLTAAGVVAGLAAAFWVTKTISALLFGVKPNDPAMLAGVAGVLFLVALAASYVPARRATRVDPMAALRCD